MQKLKLYFISEDYIDYLRQFDYRVFKNKNKKRPYIGVVYEYNEFKYFAPLASPKPKHKLISSKAWDIFKIKEGELGVINLNNMIPTPAQCLKPALSTITDPKYKTLLENQISFLNIKANKEELLYRVNRFQIFYKEGYLSKKVLERTCDFKLLEEKCLAYNKTLVNN